MRYCAMVHRTSRQLLVALACGISSCVPVRHSAELPGFSPSGSFGERVRVIAIDPGVTATIVAPAQLDAGKPIDLILYALPNGNSTAETMGRRMSDSASWRFDIQNIAAQTRALRARGMTQAVVVYLEADTKSWPAWRAKMGYDRANTRIVAIANEIREVLGNPAHVTVALTGHSGGGSFMFGFIEGQDTLPSWLGRIAFLDAVYNFEPKHGDKLAEWLRSNPRNVLVSLAYDDREIVLDGKKVVSDSGGTWRASQRMLTYFKPKIALRSDTLGEFLRYHNSQVEILLHPNPANRILHTEMVGEMNGYMHALLVRRADYDSGASVLVTRRAYMEFTDGPVTLTP
jgi:hypothetical protein